MRRKGLIILMLLVPGLWPAGTGCEKGGGQEESGFGAHEREEAVTVHLDYVSSGPAPHGVSVRGAADAAASAGDMRVKDVNVYVFNGAGDAVAFRYGTQIPALEITVQPRMLYTIYVVANAGEERPVRTSAEAEALMYEGRESGSPAHGVASVPMSGKTRPLALYDGCRVAVELTRCVAEIVVRSNYAELNPDVKLTIKSIALKNVPRAVALFGESRIASADGGRDGLALETVTPEILEAGIPFYVFENLQGTLLPGNRDQTKKTFPAGSPHAPLCTYVEMAAAYESPRKKGEIRYRFYPGTDMVSNFDILRNRRQTITVCFRKDGAVEENTWRVDHSGIRDRVTSVSVAPSSCVLAAPGGSVTLVAEVLPLQAADKRVRWSSSAPGVASVDRDGTVTAAAPGECTVTASSVENPAITGSCRVTVADSRIAFPSAGRVFYAGETALIPYAVLEPASARPRVEVSNDRAEVVSVTGEGVTVRAKSPGVCRMTAVLGNGRATYDLDIRELKISFAETGTAEVYQHFRKEIAYTVSPGHAASLPVELLLADPGADSGYVGIVPGGTRIEGLRPSDALRPTHKITLRFRDFPDRAFSIACRVKANLVLQDTLKLVANRAFSRKYGDPAARSEDAFTVDTDPRAELIWTIDRRDGLVFDRGRAALPDNKTDLNGVHNVTLSIRGENGRVMLRNDLKVIVYEELNIHSLLVQNQIGTSGEDAVFEEWRESSMCRNPLSPFSKKAGRVYPDIINVPPWGKIVNGKTLVVSKVQTAYYPIGSSHVFSPASIELLPQHRWTLNAEHGYWFYIVSYPMYQFTDSYWRLFYPEG